MVLVEVTFVVFWCVFLLHYAVDIISSRIYRTMGPDRLSFLFKAMLSDLIYGQSPTSLRCRCFQPGAALSC